MTTAAPKPIIESRDQLIASFANGEKPRSAGGSAPSTRNSSTAPRDHRAPSYDEPGGIRDLLGGLSEFGWEPVRGEAATSSR